MSGYECVQGTDVAQLEVSIVLKVACGASRRSAQLCTEGDTALVIKTITCLDKHRVGAFKLLDVAGIEAREEFVLGVVEDFFWVYFCDLVIT